MRRLIFIFIALSVNSISGYFLEYPLSLFLIKPLIENLDWNPLSKYLFVAIPFAIAFPILLGDVIYKVCIVIDKRRYVKAKFFMERFLDLTIMLCVIVMLIFAAIPPEVKKINFDKRDYIFNHMFNISRGLPIYEENYHREFRKIKNFKGTILQDAGPDGLWNTYDDVIRLDYDN